MEIIDYISQHTKIAPESLEIVLANSRSSVRHIGFSKRDGTLRRAYQPDKKTKLIQYWLIHNIFSKMPVHECAMAYKPGASILKNAAKHKGNKYVLKVDFSNFFPSIHFNDLLPYVLEWHHDVEPRWILSGKAINLIRLVCFYAGDRLPIGYPTSPIISNIVMYKFDEALITFIKSNETKFGKVTYTRYADDLIFSTLKKGGCAALLDGFQYFLSKLKSPSLTINENKTKLCSIGGGSGIITGLRLCYDGHIAVHRRYKDRVRFLLSLHGKNALRPEQIAELSGHLQFIKSVSPQLISRFAMRYSDIISSLIGDDNLRR
jgi:hypothetical protein